MRTKQIEKGLCGWLSVNPSRYYLSLLFLQDSETILKNHFHTFVNPTRTQPHKVENNFSSTLATKYYMYWYGGALDFSQISFRVKNSRKAHHVEKARKASTAEENT